MVPAEDHTVRRWRLLAGVPKGVVPAVYLEWCHTMSRYPFASAILATLKSPDDEAVHEQCHPHHPH